MDVKEIKGGSLPFAAGQTGKKEEAGELDFQKILREARSNLERPGTCVSGPAEGVSEIPEDGILTPHLLEGLKTPPPSRSAGVEATERTLNLLEEYRRALGNPRVTLREIDPLVRSLAEEARGLNRRLEDLSPSDPLKKIMTEVGILSSVEIGKFNRGDYV